MRKRLVANLVTCPTLGATAKETQTNPLLDNFGATQTTRVLNLLARLP